MIIGYSRTGGGGAWTPASVAGLKGWWDASELVGLSNNDPVGTWPDLSGNGFDLTEATNKPTYTASKINSLPAVTGNGTTAVLTNANITTGWGSSVGSLFFVTDPNSQGSQALVSIGGDVNNVWWRYTSDGGYSGTFRATRLNAAPTNVSYSGAHVWDVISGATTYKMNDNNVEVVSTTPDFQVESDMALFKTSQVADATSIAEIIVYNTEVGSTDRALIIDYLNTKYALGL